MLLIRQHFLAGHQGLLARILIWALAEILLNYVGIDDLADYSEFLFDKPDTVVISQGLEIG